MPFRTHTGVTNSAQYSMPEKLCFIDCPSDKEMCESRACRPRPLSSSDLIGRQESEDLHSGVGSPLLVARRSPGISIAMKRVSVYSKSDMDCTSLGNQVYYLDSAFSLCIDLIM